ncbi:hypothetical protein FA95DRAFT_1296312 [Auriscalpium vulgare]|uniref:Uncharacterized protein n=1 Tax=Auriscalpium vulgare TaxID=40419 RepID=A0ACB8RTR5_9AGAM|nr:hypothetical protein FA95DRAFT_1296312 [Auriscalpium vulgare]
MSDGATIDAVESRQGIAASVAFYMSKSWYRFYNLICHLSSPMPSPPPRSTDATGNTSDVGITTDAVESQRGIAAGVPSDIVLYILSLARDLSGSPNDESSKPGVPASIADWIDATRVCKSWRTAALSHGPLWARISFPSSISWLRELHIRSGTAPLSFEYHNPGTDKKAFDEWVHLLLSTSWTRAQGISFIPTWTNADEDYPFPQSLFISIIPMLGCLQTFRWRISNHDDPNILSAPHIRTLKSLSQSTLKTLRVLEICRNDDFPYYFDKDALCVFRELMRLESLNLGHYLPSAAALATVPSSDPIVLPRLGSLQLEGNVESCLAFLDILNLPSHVIATLVCMLAKEQSEHFLGPLHRFLSRDGGHSLETAEVTYAYRFPGVSLRAWSGASIDPASDDPAFQLLIICTCAARRPSSIIDYFLRSLPLPSIHTLYLLGGPWPTANTWALFRGAEHLESIVVDGAFSGRIAW